ncbi:protein CASP-like [Senna tora]|uniref:Protein CASP-like n=1 Tax=Senna tora TaxID=362788 RepID=A0A834WFY6_9FABA|nr:protein CASP-like [Senna tora]
MSRIKKKKKKKSLKKENWTAYLPGFPDSLYERWREVALEELKRELHARPTTKIVNDLLKKGNILQAVGYNSIEVEDWEVATSGEEMSKMESLFLGKVMALMGSHNRQGAYHVWLQIGHKVHDYIENGGLVDYFVS